MTTRTITAMFKTRQAAIAAGQKLVSEMGVAQAAVRTSPGEGMTDAGYDKSRPYEETGFFSSIKDMLVPDDDRFAYAEGMRRGSVLLSAQVEESEIDRASDLLEHAGALDLDAEEASWRQSGWTGYDAQAHGATTPAVAKPMAGSEGQDETVRAMQERLVVGKREVAGGRVKVRSYVVERPVEETVSLHEERIVVDRRPVDRAATAADMDAFQERTIEARGTREEAVISKETRVVEEIAIHKEATERTETVRDTVRETKIDIEGAEGSGPAGGQSSVTGAGNAMDRTLNTNVSGTNPGADAPDGTPGNPPGTMASRAVDKTLGTNISGANPDRK